MKLYGSLTSPYVRKVRLFLAEKGIAYDLVVEGPSDAAGNVARLNPLGKVPVLVRDDGEVLFDSPMLIDYLDGIKGVALIPPSGDARWQAQRWHALGQGIMDATVTRLMETRRAGEHQDATVIKKQEGKIAAALNFAEGQLSGGDWLVGDRLSIGDIAMAAALGYMDLRYAHNWQPAHPRLATWYATFSRRPSFIETAPR